MRTLSSLCLWVFCSVLFLGTLQATELEQVQPYYGKIAEDQAFILQFDQPVQAQDIVPYSFCVSSALGERIPLRTLSAKDSLLLLEEQSYSYGEENQAHFLVAQCAQRLAPGSTVRVHLQNKQGRSLVPLAFTEDAAGLGFEVRSPLRARLLCDKTKSSALCNPLLPIRVVFSAPVQAELALQLSLTSQQGQIVVAESPQGSLDYVDELVFHLPATELTSWQWLVPSDWHELTDDVGRKLDNSRLFITPLELAELPTLLKFATNTFGVLERFASAPATTQSEPALLPLAVRGVEPSLLTPQNTDSAGLVRQLHVTTPLEMLQWYARLQRVGDYTIQQAQLEAAWSLKEPVYVEHSPQIDPKTWSIFDYLQVMDQTQVIKLPATPDINDKEIELIGVPLSQPGLHILEAESQKLGQTYNEQKAPVYVRTVALVTNLAVQSKWSAKQLLVWVTRLDTAEPVAEAEVTVLSCDGQLLAQGKTDRQGRWFIEGDFEGSYCSSTGMSDVFISATINAMHPDAYGQQDSSFVLSSWDKGIESWRFQLPYFYESDQTEVVHTVIDRPLFLAGETVHLKHYWLGDAQKNVTQILPEMIIRHVGSGDEIKQALQWQRSETGAWSAVSTLDLAPQTVLGRYEISLQGPQHHFSGTSYQVEAFKRPFLTGRLGLQATGATTAGPLVALNEALVDVQLNYISGGVAAKQPVTITALAEPASARVTGYEAYRFNTPTESSRPKVLVDKVQVELDEQGAAQLGFAVATSQEAQDLRVEVSFMDPNGQIQSLAQRQTIWPADVVVGVKHPYWEESNSTHIQGVTLSPAGMPLAQQKVAVHGQRQSFMTTRQRMVGGFYRYAHEEQLTDLGLLCEATSNAEGQWACDIDFEQDGQIILHASSIDSKQRTYTTASTLWLSGANTTSTQNHDRMDVLAEKKSVLPGETVRFQVNMPFSSATALIAVEQDQVLHTELVYLHKDDPFFDLTIQKNWGPNVYVSVLALRGRIYPLSWTDFWATGWRQPLTWYNQYKNQKNTQPTTQVDLAKPSFRYGVTELRVANTSQQITVQLAATEKVYQVGQTARLQLKAELPSGAPAARASVLLVGVDQALLELLPNNSWQLLDAMYPLKGYGVRTATMQSEVIGRRHYGRKAVPAGGGGGAAPTREILDSLLVWRSDIVLDDAGKAEIDVPLNHSVTQFELVALVDYGGTLFGTAQTQIQTHQAIQVMSGLLVEVRTGDEYEAVFTVRNREPEARTVRLQAQGFIDGTLVFDLPVQSQTLQAHSTAGFTSLIKVPHQLGANAGQTQWHIAVLDAETAEPLDSLQLVQQWRASVPVTTQELLWQRLMPQRSESITLSRPAEAVALNGKYLGGVRLKLQNSLGGQESVKDWFKTYAYTCFEQQASKYLALQDLDRWQQLLQELPAYLDDQQLIRYFPSPYLSGSVALTAYMLSLSTYGPDAFALPEQTARKMLAGLHDYVEGRRQALRSDAKEQVALYLSAVSALAHYDLIRADSFERIALAVDQWPTSALIDGLYALQHPVFDGAEHKEWLMHIQTTLRQRLVQRGSALAFSDEPQNSMPALMVSPVTNQARLLITVADLPAWQAQIPALMHGLLAQQSKGHWGMTTENSWALLALARLDQHAMQIGQTRLQLEKSEAVNIAWSQTGAQSFEKQWGWEENQTFQIEHQGTAPIWLQLKAEAAVPVTQALSQGYVIQRQVTAVEQAQPDRWQVGDIYRVDITISAEKSSVWAVVNDGIPAGATILGTGLGRETQLSQKSSLSEDRSLLFPSYVERLSSGYRAYFESLPAGTSVISYMVRLNTAGQFILGQSSVESLYDAQVQAQLPIKPVTVHAAP